MKWETEKRGRRGSEINKRKFDFSIVGKELLEGKVSSRLIIIMNYLIVVPCKTLVQRSVTCTIIKNIIKR